MLVIMQSEARRHSRTKGWAAHPAKMIKPIVITLALVAAMLSAGCGSITNSAGGSTVAANGRAAFTSAEVGADGSVTVNWNPYTFNNGANGSYVVVFSQGNSSPGSLDLGKLGAQHPENFASVPAGTTTLKVPWVDPTVYPAPSFWVIPVDGGQLVTGAASAPMIVNRARAPFAGDVAGWPGWLSKDQQQNDTVTYADSGLDKAASTVDEVNGYVSNASTVITGMDGFMKVAEPVGWGIAADALSYASTVGDVAMVAYQTWNIVKDLESVQSESLTLEIDSPTGVDGSTIEPKIQSACSHGHFAGLTPATKDGTVTARWDPNQGQGGDTRIQCDVKVLTGQQGTMLTADATKSAYDQYVSFSFNYDTTDKDKDWIPEVTNFFDGAGYGDKVSIYNALSTDQWNAIKGDACGGFGNWLKNGFSVACATGIEDSPTRVSLNLGKNVWTPGVASEYYNLNAPGWKPTQSPNYRYFAGIGTPWPGDVKGAPAVPAVSNHITNDVIFDSSLGASCVAGDSSANPPTSDCGLAQLPSNIPAPPDGKRTVGYYANYSPYHAAPQFYANGQPTSIPFSALTDVNYGFAYIHNGSDFFNTGPFADYAGKTGQCVPSDPYGDLKKPYLANGYQPYQGGYNVINRYGRSVNPNIKTKLVIGGYQQTVGGSTSAPQKGDVPWGQITKDEASMDNFVQSCVALANQYGFDGITLDWEFPTAADTQNYLTLLSKFRAKLGGAPLTIAAPADPGKIPASGGKSIADSVDWLEVMAYDYYGQTFGDHRTNLNAPLYPDKSDPKATPGFSVDESVSAYLAAGVDPNKIVLGVPFYGRTYTGVAPGAPNGLYANFSGPTDANSPNAFIDYGAIAPTVGVGGNQRIWLDTQQVPVLYNAGAGTWTSYDDPQSIAAKSQYASSKNLRGTMFWESTGDSMKGDLLTALNSGKSP